MKQRISRHVEQKKKKQRVERIKDPHTNPRSRGAVVLTNSQVGGLRVDHYTS